MLLSCFGKKVTKEADLRGATGKCAPLGIPRRIAGRYKIGYVGWGLAPAVW